MKTREEALDIVNKYVKSQGLIRHMLSVEAAMRFYAKKLNQPEELWAITGLLHDFDWEIHPSSETHPANGAPILRELGVEEEIVQAILRHGDDPIQAHRHVVEAVVCRKHRLGDGRLAQVVLH